MKTKLTLILSLMLITSGHAGVLPNDAVVDGRTIGEWSAEWWKWFLPISINQNPMLDTNGAFAAVGQPAGNVFLVAHELGIIPGTYTRSFTVPEGKYLFLPLELYEADNVDTFPPLSVADLRAQAAAIVDDTKELHASLDGVDIPNLFDHRAVSPVFNVFYTDADNIHTFAFGHPITGLIDPMICDGYWLMIEPLALGPHMLHFGGSFSNAFFFKADVLDYITVVPVNHPPVADASATPSRAISPDNLNAKVTLDGSRSSDLDSDSLTYSWLEGASVLSMSNVSTNILSVGPHVISLVVNDGKISATNTITINVITAEEAVRELALMVHQAGLRRKVTQSLLDQLEDAQKAFERGHLHKGGRELEKFQEEVREHVAKVNSAIAQVFLQSAQEVIDALSQPPPEPPPVLANDAVVDGKTLSDWTADWAKWGWLQPTNQNPWFDPDGRWATNGQPGGPVFFLTGVGADFGGSFSRTRSFSVPEGKYIFFPVVDAEWENIDTVPPLTVDQLRDSAASALASLAALHVQIDGVSVPNLFQHRLMSPVYNYELATANNLKTFQYGHPITGLIDPAISDGYWIMIEPLRPGVHVINWGATLGPQPLSYTPEITEIITIVPIPLSERLHELILTVQASSLPKKRQRELIDELREAAKAFERNHLREGVEEMREFQKKVRKEIAPLDPALAEQLIQAAQKIIDKAKAQLP